MNKIITERPESMSYEDYRAIRQQQDKIIKNYLKGRTFYPAYIKVYVGIPEDKRYKKIGPFVDYKELEAKMEEKPKAKYQVKSNYVSTGIPYKK